MFNLIGVIGRIVAAVLAALGVAAAARTYTQAPPPGTVASDPQRSPPLPDTAATGGTNVEQDMQQHPGWSTAAPQTLLRPTYWPVVLALSIMFLLWGIISTIYIFGLGAILFAVALAGWIGDMLHE